ncbi:class I SAM-dependent methyltransferase [bacterium]|nr:class I SAM-dependent methyltransferase [bacterium]
MEERKQKEIEYYDRKAEEMLEKSLKDIRGDFEGFVFRDLESWCFCYELLKKYSKNKKVLDYGCGNGIHSIFLAQYAREVVAIDLSEKSLEVARKLAERNGVQQKIKFLKMDCENMNFEDNSFDVIFDGGTFSSLDLKKAIPEISRVLKKDGLVIGIETFGHNPLANLKREINKITGKRTAWAVSHIFKEKDIAFARHYFSKINIWYFHLLSWLFFPFLNLSAFKKFFKLVEAIDRKLLKVPFLKKYAFKIVFIFSDPKKES